MYITNKYATIEEFARGEWKRRNWTGGFTSKMLTLNGQTIEYIDDKQEKKAIFIVPLKAGYVLRGVYEYWPYDAEEQEPRTIEDVLTNVFGGEAEVTEESKD